MAPAMHGGRDGASLTMGRDVTPRMVEVVAAIVATGGRQAAADQLGIGIHAVDHHLARIKARLGVETPAQAIYVLTARGLLIVPGVGRRAA